MVMLHLLSDIVFKMFEILTCVSIRLKLRLLPILNADIVHIGLK